ncbi:MAG: DnaD domain protein [Oscillospiraceae bacterium]|jgi:DNA replication protein DnaD|nr:DnaD domain protein [Oscillospiraceae bacterium]
MLKFTLPLPETITVSGQAADKLIRLGDGDAALLYLHILSTRGSKSVAETAEELRRSEDAVKAAMLRLSKLGLILSDDTAVEPSETPLISPAPATGKSVQTPVTRDTAADAETDARARRALDSATPFRCLVQETQNLLGRPLSPDDMRRLFEIYDVLKLPPDVVLHLEQHCAEETRRERGEGRRPTMKYIEKAAYAWEREGIFTLERAEAYIRERAARRSGLGEVKKLLQIAGRDFSPSERKYAEGWLALGFSPGAIALAYDRTMLKTGRLAWSYMDSILNSWHGKNLHTEAEIEAKDARRDKPAYGGAQKPIAAAVPNARELARMQKLLESVTSNDERPGESG